MRYLALIIALVAQPAFAQSTETSLELVLLADGSGSIDADELAFQRQGYAEAITSPEVLSAIENTLHGHIAVVYMEWATNQAVVVDWALIDGPTSAATFAAGFDNQPRQVYGANAIGAALLEAQRQIDDNAFDGFRRVIDFSGDSIGNSSGPPIAQARDEVLAQGTTINALPILRPDSPRRAGSNLEEEYATRIIGGTGAFMVTAEDSASFADAVQRKLILEIAGRVPATDFAAQD